jgi:hypothetical protein
MQRDGDVAAEARKRFVDRVVDNFLDQVVKSALTNIADVHGRTFTNSFKSFKDFNTVFIIPRDWCGF